MRGWPLVVGRFKKYYLPLGHEENDQVEVCPAWIARLPLEWVQGQGLKLVPREGNVTNQLLSESRRLFGEANSENARAETP